MCIQLNVCVLVHHDTHTNHQQYTHPPLHVQHKYTHIPHPPTPPQHTCPLSPTNTKQHSGYIAAYSVNLDSFRFASTSYNSAFNVPLYTGISEGATDRRHPCWVPWSDVSLGVGVWVGPRPPPPVLPPPAAAGGVGVMPGVVVADVRVDAAGVGVGVGVVLLARDSRVDLPRPVVTLFLI